MRVGVGVAAAVLLALAGAPHAAAAATFTVTRLDDPTPDRCMPMDCSLREAVLAVDAGGGGDTIVLPPGHFRLTIPGTGEDAGATGDLDLTKPVTIAGAGARSTVIDGGGIDRVLDFTDTAWVFDVTITGGEVAGDGSGIRSTGSLNLSRDAISGNHAIGDGGGVESLNEINVFSSTIAGNHALHGGGIDFANSAHVVSSTVSGNVAGGPGVTGSGGGIHGSGNGSVPLSSSDITGNQAFNSSLSGAGIDSMEALFVSTIVAGNFAHTTDQSGQALANCAQAGSSSGSNLSDGTDCFIAGTGDQQGVPVLLGPLTDNGGPTDTQAVLPSSLALDASRGCPATDQRGVSRPAGRACDIGAYELAPPLVATLAATSVGFSTATLNGTVVPSLRETTAYFE